MKRLQMTSQTRAHCNLQFMDQWLSTTFKEFWTPVVTDPSTVHHRQKSPNTNGHRAQTNRYSKIVNTPK